MRRSGSSIASWSFFLSILLVVGGGVILAGERALPLDEIEARPGADFWDRADLRIVLDLGRRIPAIEIVAADHTPDRAGSAALHACGAAGHTRTFFNNRERARIEMLDVDLQALLDCIHTHHLLIEGRKLNDRSDGGLVLYLGVEGPEQGTVNAYGARIFNGAELESTIPEAPSILGLTVVSNQALYVRGSFNSIRSKPAGLLADSLNVLSDAWNDAASSGPLEGRPAIDTTVHAALLAGTDREPARFPRLHESWERSRLTCYGPFLSLGEPRHVDGLWIHGGTDYTAPERYVVTNTEFEAEAEMPPLMSRFVRPQQKRLVRQLER